MPRRLLASLVVSLLVVAAVAAVTHGQSGEYKIGVLEPLTGPLAGEGKRHLEGYEIVRDMINARGGVMGKKLVFAVADAPDPTAAATEATRLITREGVKIVTGTFSSRLCGAASEAAARHNVIYWETSCVDPRFSKRGSRPCTAPRSTPPASAGTTWSSSPSTWRRAWARSRAS
jgi:branched-chain amino acid transport system substrate-binding protein